MTKPPMDAVDRAQQKQIDRMQLVQNFMLFLTAASGVAQIVECVVIVFRGGAK